MYTSIIIFFYLLYLIDNVSRICYNITEAGMTVNEISSEEKIAQSIVPYNRDDARARYLGLRASGFTIREALKMIDKAQSTLSAWRHDETFVNLETRLPELRRELALEYANLEFLRNYRLILQKDYNVISGSLKEGQVLSDQDHSYLLKLRSHYTPQQLQIIETILVAGSGNKDFNFTDFIMSATRTQENITIATKERGNPVLTPISGGSNEKTSTSNK